MSERIVDTTPYNIAELVATGEWKPATIADADYDRRKFIGSSNAAALFGVAPTFSDGSRATPLTVWKAKTSEMPEELAPEKQLFLTRRKRWEPVVVEMLREEFDAEITSVNLRYVDPYLPFLAAELDFEWLDPETGMIEGGEIKTVSPFAFKEKFGWGEAGTEEVPIHYLAQVMHGMMVRGSRKAVLAAMVGLDSMVFYPIKRDEEMIADMRRVFLRFWNENVLANIAPTAMSMGDLKALYPTSNSMSVKAEHPTGSQALRLRAIKGQIDALELEAEFLEFEVKLAMKENEKLLVDGRAVFSWKNQAWSMLDQSELKEKEPKIYRQFLKKGTRRVFKAMFGS